MPPTKSQLKNLASMVMEIGVENIVEAAIKSAAGLPMDKHSVATSRGAGREILNLARAAISAAVDYLEKETRGD